MTKAHTFTKIKIECIQIKENKKYECYNSI